MELLEMISKGKDIIYHDYEPGKYCLDNVNNAITLIPLLLSLLL